MPHGGRRSSPAHCRETAISLASRGSRLTICASVSNQPYLPCAAMQHFTANPDILIGCVCATTHRPERRASLNRHRGCCPGHGGRERLFRRNKVTCPPPPSPNHEGAIFTTFKQHEDTHIWRSDTSDDPVKGCKGQAQWALAGASCNGSLVPRQTTVNCRLLQRRPRRIR